MSGLSSAGEYTALGSILQTCYVSLHTADPGDTGAAEIVGNGYIRQGPVPFTTSGNNPTVAANAQIISYPGATADWGTMAFFGCWTTATGGQFNGSGALDTPRQVLSGDTVRFLTGALKVSAQ